MKICPNCGREYTPSEFICAICGVSLVEKTKGNEFYTSQQPGFSLGDANAISGGVHVDSSKSYSDNSTNDLSTHDSHNVMSNSNNSNCGNVNSGNTTISITNTTVEGPKTSVQLDNEARNNFINVVSDLLHKGVYDNRVQEELNKARIQYNISENDAMEIVSTFRQNNSLSGTKGDDIAVDSVRRAIEMCNVDILKMNYPKLKELSAKSMNSSVQYYTHLVAMSNNPQNCANACAFSKTENYWQLYWACVASVRVGSQNKTKLFSQIASFENYPQGNIALLSAIEYLYAYRNNPAQRAFLNETVQYLENAQSLQISEELNPIWCTISELTANTPQPSDFIQFYCRYTFPELMPTPSIPIVNTMPPPLLDQKATQPERKKMVGADAANVKLQQMQGFNPLEGMQMGGGSPTIVGINPNANNGGLGNIQEIPVPPPVPDITKNGLDLSNKKVNIDDYLDRMRSEMEARLSGRLSGVDTSIPISGSQSPQDQQPTTVFHPLDDRSEHPDSVAEHLSSEVRYADDDIHDEDPLRDLWGIILTDPHVLATKYNCSLSNVYELLSDFIDAASERQMHWSLLDITYLQDNGVVFKSWIDYNKAISDFIAKSKLKPSADLHLFIVGGNDVVPIPFVTDPFSPYENVATDMAYAFEGNFLADLMGNAINDITISSVRNNVSRLPLEDGKLSSDIVSDLASYFNISSMYAGGIPVGNVVMTSNSEWIPASTTMSQHLPLTCETDNPDMIRNGMYVSPALLTNDIETVNIFRKSLQHSDMLMFNLHGSDGKNMSSFYSNDGEAFNIPMLHDSTARVLNTVACFGARYNGYSRTDSMLLSSLYGGGIILYTGASKSVPMLRNDEARELLLNPGTGSEVFMRLYPLYQFKGMTAGKALLQAKLDYFNMCRHVEDDEFSLSTIMMFNLYGNPMLHVRKREHVIESALENDAIPPAPIKSSGMPFRRTERTVVMSKEKANGSLLDAIRSAVDSNLEWIRKQVETHVYDELGLPPRTLEQIDSIRRPDGSGGVETGYTFYYHDPEAVFSADTRVEVDKQGKITKIYTTK